MSNYNNYNNNNNNNGSSLPHSNSYNALNQLASSSSSSFTNNNNNNNNNNMTTSSSSSGSSLLSLIPPSLIKQYDNEVVQMFERNMPDQMKTIESNTRYEIEEKKRQLRRLIGNKYRDLVEGSDSIVKMKKSCQSIQDNIKQMQSGLKSFSERRLRNNQVMLESSTSTTTSSSSMESGNLNIAIISKYAKFLIEISERIWRAIDQNEFFEAEVQFLKAKYIYSQLTTSGQLVIERLPIVYNHWQTIEQFPSKTIQSARDFLKKQHNTSNNNTSNSNNNNNSNSSNISIEQYIGALSTLILFDNYTINQTMNEFLHIRLSQLVNQLDRAIKLEYPTKLSIHKALESIKTTIFLLASRLSAMQQEDKDYSEYLWSYHDDPVKSIKNKTNGITPVAEAFLSHLSQLYTSCIGDFLNLFPADKELVTVSSSGNSSSSSVGGVTTLTSPTNSSKILSKKQQQSHAKSIVERYEMKENELREFMRKSFYNSIRLFCQNNQRSIKSLYQNNINNNNNNNNSNNNINNGNKTSSSALQELLFISKLSKLFYKHILVNPNQFLVPSTNTNTSPSSITNRLTTTTTSSLSPNFNNNNNNNNNIESLTNKVVDYLKEVYYIGFIVWIESILPTHCTSLQQRLNNESWDNSQQLTRSWEKHLIQDDNNSTGRTQIYMPYQPSHFILSLLFELSLETNKISFNTLDKNIQRYLSISLANKIYKIINSFLSEKASNFITICKEGYLQLYLDMKYLNVVLFGNKKLQPIKDNTFNTSKSYYYNNIATTTGASVPTLTSPASTTTPTTTTTTTEPEMKTMSDVINLLEEKIDPIDLILYKEYVNKFVETSYNKTTTLFGGFTKVHRSIIKSDNSLESLNISML
ncbi:oligomeric Golgi complex component [Heterostelium album PN500]|uniref:Conserved oligomeric Golgi complex subunit 1 n=1 Tax=Heterostelium pallidum (strain ATCC 26659 / Pp 5 / PN500) TaxID=670386 RepID=D3B767_HETP5|nr:oligomeric Golgi complex component [Heterostelium album PN500]EFA82610.1 oligomeric Golgi complex component [Heterostelium album PN500]|eukprot:XP_020434727.1 oligomeric Golgi complex component [Heterostelium album PN500]